MSYIREWNRARKHRRRLRLCHKELDTRDIEAKAHGLETSLVVSLTSYPKRYAILGYTLRCLLQQTIKPDRVILWTARDDIEALPSEVKALRDIGLECYACEDMRSYKKLIPTLQQDPSATIVTADDDVHYPADWLEALVEKHRETAAKVVCSKGHRVTLANDGSIAPYSDWDHNLAEGEPGIIFPTGVGGVLYAPGALASEALDWSLAKELCPTADDVWFFWMHRRTGAAAVKQGPRRRTLEWVDDPTGGLFSINNLGGNDRQIQAMVQRFGLPNF